MNEVAKATAPAEFRKAETVVLWDINRCPVPDGCDPCWVRPSIESALRESGYDGPLTISAIGDLEDIPRRVLRALSSTGIVLKHEPDITTGMILGFIDIEPPLTIMLITNSHGVDCFTYPLNLQHAKGGYNILVAYSPDFKQEEHPPLVTSAEWVWVMDGLLKDSGSADELTRQFHPVPSAGFLCLTCDWEAQNLEDFTTHLSSAEHAKEELFLSRPKAEKKIPEHKSQEQKSREADEDLKILKEIQQLVNKYAEMEIQAKKDVMTKMKIRAEKDEMTKIQAKKDQMLQFKEEDYLRKRRMKMSKVKIKTLKGKNKTS